VEGSYCGKYIIEMILVYWVALAYIAKGILDTFKRIIFIFLWPLRIVSKGIPLVKWMGNS
jgi:hypothetical protein